MKNAREYLKEKNAEETIHHGWLNDIVVKIEGFIDHERHAIDHNFPLSGGEETHHIHLAPKSEPGRKESTLISFLKDIETDFPLSGGHLDR